MEMNMRARQVGLENTFFNSPHGLSNPTNTSTAFDLAKLTRHCMKHAKFREIVRTRTYTCRAVSQDPKAIPQDPNVRVTTYYWENTNKMLHKGFVGVKTGITPNAGPCLSTCFKKDGYNIVIILLCSKSMSHRWLEIIKIVAWA